MKTITKHFSNSSFTVLSALIMVLAALCSQSALAETRAMILYSDVAGARDILSGNYDSAIETLLRTRGRGEEKISILNNLCVAYTLSGQFESARISCDKALEAAAHSKNYDDLSKLYPTPRTMRRYTSRAHVNRSILRRQAGDVSGAAADWALVRTHDK